MGFSFHNFRSFTFRCIKKGQIYLSVDLAFSAFAFGCFGPRVIILNSDNQGNDPDEGENEKDSHSEKVDADLGKVDFGSKDLEEEEREFLEAAPKQV